MDKIMWTEKYRPMSLEDMEDQDDTKERLISLLSSPLEVPHLLFAGPPGTGKTTAALCVARKILGEDWRAYTLELNASDERGIGTVRERIKVFASYYDPRVPYRIIVLDEADAMTNDAQTALRRIMEERSRVCRFILIANYSSGIIEPIQSRCAVFRFSRLPAKEVVGYLSKILEREGVWKKGGREKKDEEALSVIYEVTKGDMRHAINVLQASVALGKMTVEGVRNVAGLSAKERIGEVVKLALEGDFMEAREKMIELTAVYGISESDFMRYASEKVFDMNLPNSGEAASLLAEYDYRLIMGAHPEIQLSALLAELQRIGKGRAKKA